MATQVPIPKKIPPLPASLACGNAKPSPAATSAQRVPRMTLASITRGRIELPPRTLIYGVEGVGKSNFAAGGEGVIFIDVEGSTAELDAARYPISGDWTWQDVLDAVDALLNESHSFKGVALDTVDAIQPLIFAEVCKEAKTESIEEVGGGWKQGYVAAFDKWRVLLSRLEALRSRKNMFITLVGHSRVQSHKFPDLDPFERYQLAVNDAKNSDAAGLLKSWCDAVLFAQFETFAVKDTKTKKTRGVSSDARLMRTCRTAAWDAKNRYGLPDPMRLSWADYWGGVKKFQTSGPDALVREIERKAKMLGGEIESFSMGFLEENRDDMAKLSELNIRLQANLDKVQMGTTAADSDAGADAGAETSSEAEVEAQAVE